MRQYFAVLALVAIFAVSAFPQAAGLGGISGVVADATGSAVPGASVVVANTGTGIRRQLETNSEGVFNAPALVPGPGYSVSVTKSGFATFEGQNITVAVGQNVSLHIDLSVEATQTQVDVTATAQLVEDTKTDVSQLVNQRQILDLPINGRRVDSFVLLSPAVVPDSPFGLLSFRGVAGHNAFLTDGNDTTNQYYNENAGRTRITSQISQEAVQEFQVISNNFTAEYGNAMGGVINTITKSGTNDIHGTGYWFFRNRSLAARDRYAAFRPQDIRHQSGVSLGGPIKNDKLFYFVNYEATRRDFPAINSLSTGMFNPAGQLNPTNPSAVCTPGSLPNGSGPTAAQCAAAIDMILTRNFQTVSRTVTQDLGFAKLDYQLNERNSISAGLSMLRWVSPHGIQATGIAFTTGAAIGNNADSTVRNAISRLQWTSVISPSIVNEARFGWFKDRLHDTPSDDFLFPGLGRATLTVGGTSNLGLADAYPRLNPSEQRYQFVDNLSWTSGAHTMKFGFDFSRTLDYNSILIAQFGSYNYSNLSSFAADFSGNTTGAKNWNSYSQRFGNPTLELAQKSIGFYGQDQWRINSRLLFNYGVRYDYTAIPQPELVNPDYPQTGTIHKPKDNLAPRVGLSYAIGNDRRTLIRAGYGIFYSRFQTGLINTLHTNNNLYTKFVTYLAPAQIAPGPVYPNFLPNTELNPTPGTVDIVFADKELRNPYTHQANVGIERQLTTSLALSVSYLWSRGVRLYGVRDLNLGPASDPITYTIIGPAGDVTGTYTTPTWRGPRTDPRYRRIAQIENPGMSYYNGLAVQLNKRYSRGFQAGVAYTWSHAIDFNQSGASNNIFFGSTPTSYENGNFAAEKGSAANDVRHRLVINSVWAPTFTSNDSAWARFLVNNWQLSQVTTLQSAQPINSTTNITGNAFAGNLFNQSLNGQGGGFSRVPFEPVSNLDLDQIYRVDARLSKKLPFGERVTVYLQIEAFNLFNTQYDTNRRNQKYNFEAPTANEPRAILRYRSDYGTGSSTALSPDGTNARRAQVSLRATF